MRLSTIELFKEEMKFSAGHFTIFGPTERENLHGHNFNIAVHLTGEVAAHQGMLSLSDFGNCERLIAERCRVWNETFLLPTQSPHLRLTTDANGDVHAVFNNERLFFLKRDVTLLPAANITLEELARLFGEGFIQEPARLQQDKICALLVKCSTGPGQWATWAWASP
jgi:6-pyruvoyltetrahydropterin/6-carboxytetrahydropterin synthase